VCAIGVLLGTGTPARAGLIITPTYDSSITTDPNSAAIQSTIQTAISTYQNLFANPVNVTIYFREGGGLGSSSAAFYNIGYSAFRSGLQNNFASSGNANQGTALANLPTGANNPVNNTPDLAVSSADGRALGQNTPGAVDSNGNLGGTYDGMIALNTLLTTPGSPGSTQQYSLLTVVEHEIDEVLGLPSFVGATLPSAMDLYRFAGNSTTRNWTTSGDNAFFSFDGGATDIAQYNQRQQTGTGDFGDWHLGSSPTRVQDAFATQGASATILNDGGAEIAALNVIGYNEVGPSAAAPEPGTLTLLGAAGLLLSGYRMRRRIRGSRLP
jgi:hypothetical protein